MEDQQWNILLYDAVKIIVHKRSMINYDTYVKLFYIGEVSYITMSMDNVINNTNNEETFR